MAIRHILYCYRPGARADEGLRLACRLALRENASMSVGIDPQDTFLVEQSDEFRSMIVELDRSSS